VNCLDCRTELNAFNKWDRYCFNCFHTRYMEWSTNRVIEKENA